MQLLTPLTTENYPEPSVIRVEPAHVIFLEG
jgi:hypothetical protein